jgi:hypothetical protein
MEWKKNRVCNKSKYRTIRISLSHFCLRDFYVVSLQKGKGSLDLVAGYAHRVCVSGVHVLSTDAADGISYTTHANKTK